MCQPELALTRIKRDDSKAEGHTRDRESYCKCFLVPSDEESVSGSENKTLISNKSQSVVSIRASNSKMLEGKALVEDTDMPLKMQIQAMSCAPQALDLYDVLDCESIAAHIKKDFDSRYGGGWQCVVGSKFGCFFTHAKGTFIYFKLERLNFLIFKGASSPTCR